MKRSPFITAHFPRTANYDPAWVRKHSLGENVLYNTESLCEVLPLEKGMRVLDMGSGRAISSIFIAKESGATVWAVDAEVPVAENLARAETMGCHDLVIPIQERVEHLRFPPNFFDAIIGIDIIHYIGATPRFLPFITHMLKPGGRIGIVDACTLRDISSIETAPQHLKPLYADVWSHLHSLQWWKHLWERSDLITIEHAEPIRESQELIREYINDNRGDPGELAIVKALEADQGRTISLLRMVARKI